MNKAKTASALAAMAGLAITAPALAADFSYDYVEADLILADAGANDGKGPGIVGSITLPQVHENFTLVGGANYLDFEGDLSVLTLEGGAGFHWPVASVLDVVGTGSLVYQRWDFGPAEDSDIGLALTGGVRAKPFGEQWEFNGGVKFIDVGNYEDTILDVGARYYFSSGLSAGLKLETGDIDKVTLSLRWNIGGR
jgi:hypothetical protein